MTSRTTSTVTTQIRCGGKHLANAADMRSHSLNARSDGAEGRGGDPNSREVLTVSDITAPLSTHTACAAIHRLQAGAPASQLCVA